MWMNRDALVRLGGRVRSVAVAPAVDGQLVSACRIETQPPGAKVLLDGVELEARTPLRVELIPDVEHEVEIRHAGRATVVKTVLGRVSPEEQRLDVVLEPAATLELDSSPRGATVVVDGRELANKTPVVVDDAPAGRTIRVRAEYPGYAPAVRSVSLEAGETVEVEFQLGR